MSDSRIAALPPRPVTHIAPEDLVLYAMGYLPAPETLGVQHHVEQCASCGEELGRTYLDLGVMALTAEQCPPHPSARDRLLAQVAREQKIVASPPTKVAVASPDATEPGLRPLADFGRGKGTTLIAEPVVPHSDREARIRWAGWILASALAGLSGLFYTSYRRVQENLTNVTGEMQRLTGRAAQSHHLMDALTDPQATRAMLAPRGLARATRKGPTATITYEASKGSLVFLGTNLDPVQLYKTYELWVLPADGSTPIPAGTFHPDEHGNASVIMPVIRTGVRAKAFEVTLEDKGGADKPTPPIILSTN